MTFENVSVRRAILIGQFIIINILYYYNSGNYILLIYYTLPSF